MKQQSSEDTKQQSKKNDLHYSVTIDATFGSELQHTVATCLLDHFLAAWKAEAESYHKKSSVTIIRGSETAPASA